MIVLLKEIIFDNRARDGTWCCLPYSGHPKGCPNYPTSPDRQPDLSKMERLGSRRRVFSWGW